MGRLQTACLSQPLNIACFAFATVTAMANLNLGARNAAQALSKSTSAWRILAFLAAINIVSIMIQTATAAYIYWEPPQTEIALTVGRVCTALLFLGFGLAQLELWVVFGVLFAKRPQDVWSPVAKSRAQIAIVVGHLLLAWGEYVPESVLTEPTLASVSAPAQRKQQLATSAITWPRLTISPTYLSMCATPHSRNIARQQIVNTSVTLHALVLTIAGSYQAYIVTLALARTSKKLSADDTTQTRRRLIAIVALSMAAGTAGLVAYAYRAMTPQASSLDALNLQMMLYQLSLACLGSEAVLQSLSLMIMMRLVAGKPVNAFGGNGSGNSGGGGVGAGVRGLIRKISKYSAKSPGKSMVEVATNDTESEGTVVVPQPPPPSLAEK
ncbi:hypothetical protein HK105_202516 [Polyrhizophydium stewartii]|uniref:Uncharacterized protein n=1 Tax=Polyrhizophydium stewartii TaxID=2732419 RepID=A0ABR4NF29_9FUNG